MWLHNVETHVSKNVLVLLNETRVHTQTLYVPHVEPHALGSTDVSQCESSVDENEFVVEHQRKH